MYQIPTIPVEKTILYIQDEENLKQYRPFKISLQKAWGQAGNLGCAHVEGCLRRLPLYINVVFNASWEYLRCEEVKDVLL